LQLVDVITSLRRHWRASLALVVLVAIALGAFLFLLSDARPPDRWEGGAQVLVPYRTEDGELPEGVPPQLLQGQSALALSDRTTDTALASVDLDEAARDDVEFDFVENELGDIHTLTVTAPTEAQAEELAASFARAYLAARRQRVVATAEQARSAAQAAASRLGERLDAVEAELRRLDPDLLASLPDAPAIEEAPPGAAEGEEEIATVDLPESTPLELELLAYERQNTLRRLEDYRRSYAQNSTDTLVPNAYATILGVGRPDQVTPEPPSPLLPIGAAIGLAALLAVGVPVLLDRVDHSIRDARAAGNALSAPILSTIPAPSASERATLSSPGSVRAQAYQTLAAASVATDQLPRAIMVTAPVGDTQDSVAANFAAALAGLGLRVALIGTQSRQSWFGHPADGAPTLPDFLTAAFSGRLNGQVCDHLVDTAVPNLGVLPAGDTETDILVDGLPPLLRSLADAGVDVTVIAGPSILEDPSATIMAWSTRSVLWVVETGVMTEQQAGDAASRLELAGASPFGVALVQRNG
jgi:Mrp family chromosome partitioning ATPase